MTDGGDDGCLDWMGRGGLIVGRSIVASWWVDPSTRLDQVTIPNLSPNNNINTKNQVAREVFEHLHHLELNFHLNRSTGAVSRVIDRGAR
jgi:hypothetical protein